MHIGQSVRTVKNKMFDGYRGEIVRIETRRCSSGTVLWVIFPDHPWHKIEPTPFAFKASEVIPEKPHSREEL
jgi:hypothetical protein